jgi:hypothetical protein
VLAALLIAAIATASAAAPGNCLSVIAGLDTTSRNSSRSTILGSAVGQTFRAVDTVVRRITVWRGPNDIDGIATKLFITAVDTTRIPAYPLTVADSILHSGPTVLVRNSDPPGQLIRMDFILDPPLVLPHSGIYAFFLQREYCDAGESAYIAAEPGIYPDGTFWVTTRAVAACYLPNIKTWEDLDLIFEIEYCRDLTTPTRRATWGQLKILYR